MTSAGVGPAPRAMDTLNEVYSSLSTKRRYEVWFLRLGLADGSGAWWFRYLLLNPGRGGTGENPAGMPVQVWATFFDANAKPRTFIQGFSVESLDLSGRGESPFHFAAADNAIDDNSCRGCLHVDGHDISWNLRYRSTFRVTLSDKGWIGFSRSPHSDAIFSGRVVFDGRVFEGDPLGFGVQGHNCGYRHRTFWRWAHAFFPREGRPSTLEALVYDMPLGFNFWKAVLWHDGKESTFYRCRQTECDQENFRWGFQCETNEMKLDAVIDGAGSSVHCLPYFKTDCLGTFPVLNNSLSRATLRIEGRRGQVETLETATGAALEIGGQG